MDSQESQGPRPGPAETPETETVRGWPGGPPRTRLPEPESLARGTQVGRYVLLDAVGAGGMGVVYAAYDPELDRKVAIKLLRFDRLGSEAGERDRLRLQREAQAIARLSHPNVVHVYDVGPFGDQVFVAMEFVAGRTLRQWAEEEPRPWREVVDRFVLAGRGLAAAHAAGLVHRDFKPDNVLLGDDGRVRVVDFGLARPTGEELSAEGERTPAGAPLTQPLTEWGVIVGTPAYMAPEQLRGEASDERSDQFSFCASLYEALYGERPFAGETSGDLAAAYTRGEAPRPPERVKVPTRVRQALLRGLSLAPGSRFSSMAELLRELERDASASRRRWLAAAAVAALAAAGLAQWGWSRAQLCSGAEARLAGVWDGERKQAVRTAFLATGTPFARAAWDGAERALERYTRSWTGMHREACEASRLRGEQSEEMLDRRMACLDRRLGEVRALTGLFARADRQVVEKAVQAAGGLASLEPCADLQALREGGPLPADPAARREVEALDRAMADVRALRAAGKLPEALERMRPVAARSRKVAHAPTRAEALYLLGDLEERAGQAGPAEKTLREALLAAEAAAHDEVKAAAAVTLVHLLGQDELRFEPAHEWASLAEATLARLGGKAPALEADYLQGLGRLYAAEGRYQDAFDRHREAAEIRRRVLGAESPDLAAAISDSGVARYRLGQYAEAMESFQQALAVQTAALGPEHPEVGSTLNRIGGALYSQGRCQEAVPRFQQALAIRERALGPDHPLVADTLSNLGNCFDELARHEEAIAHARRSLEIRRKVLGEGHADLAASLDNIGAIYSNHRQFPQALSYHRQALEIRLQTLGPDHPRTALTLFNLGTAHQESGEDIRALPYLQRSLAVWEKASGPDHPDVAEALSGIALAELRLGRTGAAREKVERALKIQEVQELELGTVSATRFVLARVLWDSGERARALDLARRVRSDLATLGASEAHFLAEVDAWLRERGKGGDGG